MFYPRGMIDDSDMVLLALVFSGAFTLYLFLREKMSKGK